MTLADPAAPAPPSVPLDKPLYGASFTQATTRLFAKYAVFSGRASRSEFWWATFFFVLGTSLTWGAGIAVGLATGTPYVDPTTGRSSITPGPAFLIFAGIGTLFFLAILVPSIAVTVRRLHDANLSGAFYFLGFVPSVGGIILLVLALLESRPEGARFDADAQPYQAPPPPAGR
jgi:uncharacterized membrane protein YhaH (DUF805 family)